MNNKAHELDQLAVARHALQAALNWMEHVERPRVGTSAVTWRLQQETFRVVRAAIKQLEPPADCHTCRNSGVIPTKRRNSHTMLNCPDCPRGIEGWHGPAYGERK
jgi:hypothetical protein